MRVSHVLFAVALAVAAATASPAAADLPPSCTATPTDPVCAFKCTSGTTPTLNVVGTSTVAGRMACDGELAACFGSVHCSVDLPGRTGDGVCRLVTGSYANCAPGA